MRIYNVGIIGYGGFGRFLHHAWEKLDNIKIYAVSDLNKSSSHDENIVFYTNWKELISNPLLDIVSIATPPSTHAKIACEAMKHGKNVLIEKPVATTMEDVEKIIATQKETGKKAMVNYVLRFTPLIELLASITRNNTFGALQRVIVENYAQDESLSKEHWFWNRNISGGILVEHGVHFIDIVNNIVQTKPVTISGTAYSRTEHQQDRVSASVLYANGVFATHYHSFNRPGFFEDATIRLVYDLAELETQGWVPLSGKIKALVNDTIKGQLHLFPNFVMEKQVAIADIQDISRPKGWGGTAPRAENVKTINSNGKEYEVNKMIEGNFSLSDDKGTVYTAALKKVMHNFIESIKHDTVPRTTLEDGKDSLYIALEALKSSTLG